MPTQTQIQNHQQVDKFAADLLKAIGAKYSKQNVNFVRAWCAWENSDYEFNPLATTQEMDGSTGMLVQNYVSYRQGLDATVITIKNGYYNNIVAMLRENESFDTADNQFRVMKELNTWGTGGNNVLTKYNEMKERPVSAAASFIASGSFLSYIIVFGIIYLIVKKVFFNGLKSRY